MKSGKLLAIVAVVVVFLCGSAFAQSNPNEEQGLKPYDSLHGGDLDSVSLTNGGLVLHIPLASFPQRGNLDLSFMVSFSSKQWFVKPQRLDAGGNVISPAVWQPMANSGTQIVSSVDWWLQLGLDTVGGTWSRGITSPDGNAHQLGGGTAALTYPLYSHDATGIMHPDVNTIILKNGTRFSYPNSPFPGRSQVAIQPSSVTDANGNQITIGANGWTDTLGRVIPGYTPATSSPVLPGVPTTDLSTCPAGTTSAWVWNVPGVNGVNGGVRTFKFCYSPVTLQTNFGQSGVNEYGPVTIHLVTAVVLPDLNMWTFAYDSYGDVTRLGLPTGGSISYTYTTGPPMCEDTQLSKWLASRTVDANDGSGGHTWNYTYASGTTTVTSPDGNDTVHTIGLPVPGAYCSLFETQVKYYQGSASAGTLLNTVSTQYSGNQDFFALAGDGTTAANVLPTQVTTTLPGGQTARVVNTWDSGGLVSDNFLILFGDLMQRDDYDFSNALVRSTVNHYLWQDNATYKSNNFLGLVSSSTLKDGASSQVAQTTYTYDQASLVSSGIGTPTHVAPPAGEPIRGNLTTTSHWLDSTNSFLSSTATYFDTGMPASSTPPPNADGKNRTTTYSYSSTFLGAYVTQTNMPDTQMPDTGAPVVHHIISGNYDFNTGLLTSFTDENGQPYTYQYDIMLRLTQGNHPDQGVTKFIYPDPNTVERQRLISGTTYDDFKVKFDGVGVPIKASS